MYVRRRRTRVDIWTPAKLNLFLEVLRRREDGFHEIETLMVPVSLYDALTFCDAHPSDPVPPLSGSTTEQNVAETSAWFSFSASWMVGDQTRELTGDQAADGLPTGPDNLVYRAIDLLRRRAEVEQGRRLRGLEVRLLKRIPSAAGLGGGSSDAAAALIGANLWWKLGWSAAKLSELAGELGSDVPFFVWQGLALCRGRGERVDCLPRPPRPLHFVVVRPPQGLSTVEVYRHTRVPDSPHRVEPLVAAIQIDNPAKWAPLMFNRLEDAALSVAPWMQEVREQFRHLAVLGHQLSGSGSSYFGVCRSRKQACQVAAIVRSRGVGRTFSVTSVGGSPYAAMQPSQN